MWNVEVLMNAFTVLALRPPPPFAHTHTHLFFPSLPDCQAVVFVDIVQHRECFILAL